MAVGFFYIMTIIRSPGPLSPPLFSTSRLRLLFRCLLEDCYHLYKSENSEKSKMSEKSEKSKMSEKYEKSAKSGQNELGHGCDAKRT